MGKLIYMLNVSLDGFVETPDRSIDWGLVDDELHGWFNDQTRSIEASLYGRRTYELMAAYWPTAEENPNSKPVEREFARLWKQQPRIVFSTTLQSVAHNSRLVRGDVAEVLARVRQEFKGDLDVGGATLAAQFIERGLVDEFRLVIHPVVIGGGMPFFPPLAKRIQLRQTESKRFASGVMYLGYEVVR